MEIESLQQNYTKDCSSSLSESEEELIVPELINTNKKKNNKSDNLNSTDENGIEEESISDELVVSIDPTLLLPHSQKLIAPKKQSRGTLDPVLYPFTCDLCGHRFSIKHNVTTHKRKHHKLYQYPCLICHETFDKKKALLKHFPSHAANDGMYHCEFCTKMWSDCKALLRHIKLHVLPKKFVCDNCDMKFKTKGELKSHSSQHAASRRFTCETCRQGFISRGRLKDHMNTHLNVRPYVCGTCNKDFKTQSAVSNHRKTHLDMTLRPYECIFCSLRFITKATRRKHMKTHLGEKDFKCTHCDAQFSAQCSLTRHFQSKHDTFLEYFVCNVGKCSNNTFNDSCTYKAHLKTHYPSKRYTCKHCKRQFTNRSSYGKHMQLKHDIAIGRIRPRNNLVDERKIADSFLNAIISDNEDRKRELLEKMSGRCAALVAAIPNSTGRNNTRNTESS